MIGHSVRTIGSALTLSFLLGALTGCANPNLDELRQYVNEKKALPPGRIEPLPEIKQVSTFLYEPQGRRNPFAPTGEERPNEARLAENGISPDFNRRREELEGFTLDAIRMVGILEQSGITWGLVKTKEGTIHRVKTGNYMGQNHGRIIQITEDKIELTEIVQDGTGGYSERQASLALAE
ncbi:MAG: pilus assembly protein PilP [Candidatus Thiodiazotropha sp. (ex Monitilora ramsayi)]|nr:pilus assembly protein PilP [Candidatus Thiodiazotropha sp. (ex Monitilora ramsayi)]